MHADPAWRENLFQMGTTPPTQCSESTHGEFSATFRGIMRVRTVTGCGQEVPRPTLRNFPSSCRMLLEQRAQRFPLSAQSFRRTFGRIFPTKFPQDFPHKVSAGLSPQSFRRTFSTKFPQDFLHRVSAGLSAQSFRRTFHTKFPLEFPQGFRTDACREVLPKSLRIQCPWLGLKEGERYEDPVPCRNWSDKPLGNRCSQTERQKTFRQVSAGAPCMGALLV